MEIYLAKTQGFCAGVSYAISIVEKALDKYGAPLYVYHDIVHNTHIVNDFKNKGVIFVDDINNVPEGDRIIFSAHGVPPFAIEQASNRNLLIIDATCPLVNKVHKEAKNFSDLGYHVILIGHKDHQETIGTSGYVDPKYLHLIQNKDDIDKLDIDNDADLGCITQTTLSVNDTKDMIDALSKRFKSLHLPFSSDLCYATQNRQDAIKNLAEICDVIFVCGSLNSSNTNRLKEVGEKSGIKSFIVDSADELEIKMLDGRSKVGVSSGASVPRFVVEDVVNKIKQLYPESIIHEFEDPEKQIEFKLPEI